MTHPPLNYEIKKYPNRRFYDATRSRHVTLDELYDLVRSGSSIRVTDSNSGEDITNLILTQMILEHDAPKLHLFPAGLLHQVIQTNQQMVQSFVDRYFARALDAFLHSQQQFEDFLRRAGLPQSSQFANPWNWARVFMGGPADAEQTPPHHARANGEPPLRDPVHADAEPPPPHPIPPDSSASPHSTRNESAELAALRAQLADLATQLSDLQRRATDRRGAARQNARSRRGRRPKPR